MWQQLVIAVLVSVAAGYVTWTLLPLLTRQRLLDALAARGVLPGAAARHRARLTTPGCGRCAGGHAPKVANRRRADI